MSVDQLLQKSIELLTKTPTPDGFLRLAVTIAQEVNAIQALSGNEKKTIVLDILKQAVQKSTLSNDQKTELSGLLKTVVPATLDIAVSVARGGFSLQKPKVGCVAALCRMVLAVAPIDPKLKEMASSGLNKAEELATAIEDGKSVSDVAQGAVKEAVAAVAEAPVVVAAVAEVKKEVEAAVSEVVAEVKEKAEAAFAAVGSSVTQSVDADPSIGILIIAAPPPPVPSNSPAPPAQIEETAQDEKVEKTANVQDWGESK
jgi:hypothetical protein